VIVRKILRWLLTLLALATWVITPAFAQAEMRALIGELNLTEFPRVITYLDVRGPQGFFIPGLPSEVMTIYEDEQPMVGTLTEVRTGSQVVFALGGGESFNIRTLGGAVSRHELIREWLQDWAASGAETGLDDLSLVVPQGVLINHEPDPLLWAAGLQAYEIDESIAATSLEALSVAIDIAMEPTPAEGMGRAVVFLSAAITDSQLSTFQSLIDRAEQGGVRVNIGLVASEAVFVTDMAQVMQAGAFQTGGQYFAFSSDEILPDLGMMLESSRRAYFLEYRSQVNTPGTHTVYVVVQTELGEIRSQTVSYESTLAAPSPIFVSPPTQVVRAVPAGESSELENLAPDDVRIDLLVEFPDSILRQLASAALYVNGEKVVENTSPPFEAFTLDLTPYQESENIILRAEVVDELGMLGSSVDISLEVLVQQPQGGLFSVFGKNLSLIAGGVVLLSGSVLLLVLVLAGRLRPRKIGERRRRRTAELDPVTQPVQLQGDDKTEQQASGLNRLSQRLPARLPWQQRSRTTPVAYLVQLDNEGHVLPESEYPITTTELSFGSDAAAGIIIQDPAVEGQHTRIWRDEKEKFFIADMGTEAGTWLNYAPVSTSGSQLEHGDLVHVGRVGYRFTFSRPTRSRRTVVTPLNEQPISKKDM
jgi:hypothetical protein